MTFSVTVKGSTSTKCWWTMPIPRAIADRVGLAILASCPVDHDASVVGRIHPVEDAHQRGLAGPVLADERVDLARPELQGDVVVRQHTGEPFGDVLEDDEGRGAARPAPPSSTIVDPVDPSSGRLGGQTSGTTMSPSMICCL